VWLRQPDSSAAP